MTSSARDLIARTIERIRKVRTCAVSIIACVEYQHAMRASCSSDRTLITLIRFFNNIYYVVRRRDKKRVMSDCLCSCRYRSYENRNELHFQYGILNCRRRMLLSSLAIYHVVGNGLSPFRAMSYRKLIRRPVQFDRIVYSGNYYSNRGIINKFRSIHHNRGSPFYHYVVRAFSSAELVRIGSDEKYR